MVIVKDDESPHELSDWDMRVKVKKEMSADHLKEKRNRRPTIKEIPIPPHEKKQSLFELMDPHRKLLLNLMKWIREPFGDTFAISLMRMIS